MKGYEYLKKIREYCDYLQEHLENVEKAWNVIKEKCQNQNVVWDDHLYWFVDGLVKQHDVSKFSAQEFIPYQERFFGVKNTVKTGSFEEAWENHKDKNPHHWEHWTAREYGYPNEDAVHCICMIIDWMAMGMKFGDTAQSYYENNKDKIKLPEWADRFCNEVFEAVYGT